MLRFHHAVHLLGHFTGKWIGLGTCCNTRWGLSPPDYYEAFLPNVQNKNDKKNPNQFSTLRHMHFMCENEIVILHHVSIKGKWVWKPAPWNKLSHFAYVIRLVLSLPGRTDRNRSRQLNIFVSWAYANIWFHTFAILVPVILKLIRHKSLCLYTNCCWERFQHFSIWILQKLSLHNLLKLIKNSEYLNPLKIYIYFILGFWNCLIALGLIYWNDLP